MDFQRWVSRRRLPPHCCQACGYNLTGNVSGVCPECGVKVDLRALQHKSSESWRWEPFAALACLLLGWSAAGLEVRGGTPTLRELLPGIVGTACGIGLALSGCRKGFAFSRMLSAFALILNLLIAWMILSKWTG